MMMTAKDKPKVIRYSKNPAIFVEKIRKYFSILIPIPIGSIILTNPEKRNNKATK